MKEIQLSKGQIALVDDEDFDWLNQWKWTYDNKGYAYRQDKKSPLQMHRLIMGLVKNDGKEVDHKNNNGLDNQRCNLRVCTRRENNLNLRKRSDNKSGHKGISWDSSRNKWFVFTTMNGKTISLGRFLKIDDAIKTINNYRLKNHGDFANDGVSNMMLGDKK